MLAGTVVNLGAINYRQCTQRYGGNTETVLIKKGY